MNENYIQIRPGLRLPIIDCKSWRVLHGKQVCVDGRDVSRCASCEARVSRQGNYEDPPIFGTAPRQAATPSAPKPPVAEPPESAEPVDGKWRGLGDVVAAATKAVGIKPCGGCQKRREALNRAVPFRSSAENPPDA